MNKFLGGVGRALIIRGNDLIGVGKTFTDSSIELSVASEEVRGGNSNMLWGKYFHDPNLNVSISDAMFSLDYFAASIGVSVQSGGLSIKEEQVLASSGTITATETPVATAGAVIGWYKRPSDENWTVGTFAGSSISVAGASDNTVYCLKYFYNNTNARSVVIGNYVPAELHLVIIADEFNGDISQDPSSSTKVGRVITDIPRYQLDGGQTISLTGTSTTGISLSGSALAVSDPNSCEDEVYYGTMTEEIFGETWQDRVIAIAPVDGEVELANDETATISVYAVFGGGMASAKKENSNFTFTVIDGTSATVNSSGVITASSSIDGVTTIEVSLTGYTNVSPAYLRVTVA